MRVYDFIGQRIEVGGWVAATGGGNAKGEYGAILYKVLGVDRSKLKLQRLRATYLDFESSRAEVGTFTTSTPNKYIVVHPNPVVKALFEAVVNGTATQENHFVVSRWVRGKMAMGIWE